MNNSRSTVVNTDDGATIIYSPPEHNNYLLDNPQVPGGGGPHWIGRDGTINPNARKDIEDRIGQANLAMPLEQVITAGDQYGLVNVGLEDFVQLTLDDLSSLPLGGTEMGLEQLCKVDAGLAVRHFHMSFCQPAARTSWATPVNEPSGNMTTMPRPALPTSTYDATYDAWNRMTSVTIGGLDVIACQYDGRDRRIIKQSASETRHYYYTNDWQDIEERVGTATTMDKQCVWGLRYVDDLVCRDDADNTTTPRLYGMQDANFNLTGVSNASGGAVLERYLFDPYGYRTS